MLLEVSKPDQAIEMLKKISAPDFNVLYKWDKDEKKWKDKTTDEIPQEIFGKTQTDLRNYASAQYGIARALREAKKFKEAEDLLKPIIEGDEKRRRGEPDVISGRNWPWSTKARPR